MKLRPNWRSVWLLSLAGLAYYLCGWIIMPRQSPEILSNIIWPSAGIALAACILGGSWAALPIGVANLALGFTWHFPPQGVIPTALATATEAALGAYFLKKVIDRESLLRTLRGVVAFLLLGSILPTLIAATGCEIVHTLFGIHEWHELPARIFLWGQADFLGVLMFTPVILVWAQKPEWKLRWSRIAETTLVFAGLIVVCVGSFINWGGLVNWPPVYSYFVVPFLLWATIRLGQRASFAASVVVAVFCLWGTFLPTNWLTPNWAWGALVMVAGLQLFHSASVEQQKDTTVEQKRLASVLEETPELVALTDTAGTIQYMNHAGRKLLGIGDDENVSALQMADFHPAEVQERIAQECIPNAVNRGVWSGELVLRSRSGQMMPVLQVILAHKDSEGAVKFFAMVGRDLTELKNAQAALYDSERKFLQAQKMESIALLAGGIAHDFNNMLSVIIGQSHLLTEELGNETAAGRRLQGISEAASRAAGLTRQLLAFSRRQVLQPRVVNLNNTVREMANMFKHLLGSNIQIRLQLQEELGNVNIDPGQLDQIVMNLAVNARDAMPKGGTLIIQTGNRELDESCASVEEPIRPGQYVMLSVSDTGIGMDAETQARIFEPFFTTKPLEQGTGLGLATVYGITKQSGGHIWVYSEQDKGTTFGIFLPRVGGEVRKEIETHPRDLRGRESVLLVEDEPALRSLVADILTRSGYTAMAASPDDALNIAGREDLRIDLLLTDMVMPNISGEVLARKCLQLRPELKVVYMSGYAPEILASGESLQQSSFVQKPFTSRALLEKLRQVLDLGKAAASAGP